MHGSKKPVDNPLIHIHAPTCPELGAGGVAGLQSPPSPPLGGGGLRRSGVRAAVYWCAGPLDPLLPPKAGPSVYIYQKNSIFYPFSGRTSGLLPLGLLCGALVLGRTSGRTGSGHVQDIGVRCVRCYCDGYGFKIHTRSRLVGGSENTVIYGYLLYVLNLIGTGLCGWGWCWKCGQVTIFGGLNKVMRYVPSLRFCDGQLRPSGDGADPVAALPRGLRCDLGHVGSFFSPLAAYYKPRNRGYRTPVPERP